MNLDFLTGENIITAYELKNSYIKMKCPDYLRSEFPFSYVVGTITNAQYNKSTGDIAIAIKPIIMILLLPIQLIFRKIKQFYNILKNKIFK